MNSLYIYFFGMIVSFPIVFHILFKLKFQELFNAKNIWEIKVAYVLFSLAICHILGCLIEKLYELSISF